MAVRKRDGAEGPKKSMPKARKRPSGVERHGGGARGGGYSVITAPRRKPDPTAKIRGTRKK